MHPKAEAPTTGKKFLDWRDAQKVLAEGDMPIIAEGGLLAA